MAKKHGDVSIFIYINYLLEVVFIIAFEYRKTTQETILFTLVYNMSNYNVYEFRSPHSEFRELKRNAIYFQGAREHWQLSLRSYRASS